MLQRFVIGWVVIAFCNYLSATTTFANSPEVSVIEPLGGTRGTELELLLRGARLSNPQELVVYEPGITVAGLEKVGDKADAVKARLKIAADARLGEYHVRLRTSGGWGHLHTFWVGPYPVVAETEPNGNFKEPQKIGLGTTVSGIVQNEDVDYFAVEAKKGQLLSVEVEAVRLGRAMFDAAVTIYDADRFELATADDTPLLNQDCFAQAIAPADGTYIVAVRESSFGGAGNYFYRLHIGDFPRPTVVYPVGGQAGQELDVTFSGDEQGPIKSKLKLPEQPTPKFGAFAARDGRTSPSPNWLRVSPFANFLETEPNAGFDKANVASTVPIALNGIVQEPRDVDIFRITLAQGQAIDVRMFARGLGSPLDPVLDLFDAAGKHLAGNDDEGNNLDSYLRFSAPAAGDYHLHVRDQLMKGGPDFVYRIEVTPVAPRLGLVIPEVARDDNQNRQWIAVPRGSRWTTLLQANRGDFGGPLTIAAADLPQGVSLVAPPVADNSGTVNVVFEAAADAPLGGKLVDLTARHADPNVAIAGRYEQNLALVRGNPNNTPYYSTKVDRIAVAVVDEAPFAVRIVEPKVPLLQSGGMNLKIVVEKKAGWDEEVRVQLPFRPPGLNVQPEILIGKGQTEGYFPMNANSNAAVGDWSLSVAAYANLGGGQVWVGSPLAKLTIAPFFLGGQVQMAAAEQGKPVDVLVKLQPNTAFDGKAKLELLGLPNKVTTEPLEIAKDATEVVFRLTVDPTSPEGQHQSLFCQLSLARDGETMAHTFAGGGTLRIDKPRPAPAPAAAAPAAPAQPMPAATAQAAPPPPPKPLSRLEQLRLERQKQTEGQGTRLEGKQP